jgi:hypothetical protein
MDLLQIRRKFVQLSGRYDLVVDATDYADNGADFFINAGQMYLDRLGTHTKSQARYWGTLSAGDYYLNITRARAVKRIWVSTTDQKWEVVKKDIVSIKNYYDKPPADLDDGRPLYYAPTVLRNIPEESDKIIIDDFGGTSTDEIVDEHYLYHGIVLYPPADETYRAEVWGLFYTNELSGDDDESWWSVVHPIALVMGAMREMEAMYRNTEGVKDWERAVLAEIIGLDKDLVEEDIAAIDQIEG